MKLTALRKSSQVRFEAEGEAPAFILIRCADIEFSEKLGSQSGSDLRALAETDKTDLAKVAAAASSAQSSLTDLRMAYLDTYVIGWGGWEGVDGQPLADRDASGKLIVENGMLLLAQEEIWDAVQREIAAQREAKNAEVTKAAGNSQAPSPVN